MRTAMRLPWLVTRRGSAEATWKGEGEAEAEAEAEEVQSEASSSAESVRQRHTWPSLECVMRARAPEASEVLTRVVG